MERDEEHFCRFFTRRNIRTGPYTAGTKVGFSAPRLAFIKRGGCVVETQDGAVFGLREGDIWFLPKLFSYVSHWYGEEVFFDMVEFDVDFLSLYYQSMQVLHFPEAEKDFEFLLLAWEKEDSFESLAALYLLLHRVLPLLKKSENKWGDRILPALKYLRDQNSESVRVEEVAALCYMSPSRFFEVFREAVGVSPIQYKNRIKLARAEALLLQGKTTEEVCEILHFSSPTFMRRMMKKHLGMTPRDIKKGSSI
jgi:AraC-like DNA-binding protein